MRLAILADIHERTDALAAVIEALGAAGPDRWIVLGDTFDEGVSVGRTIELLRPLNPQGVWGNHDYGLCSEPDVADGMDLNEADRAFLLRFRPRVRVGPCLFQHVDPWLDAESVADLWHPGDAPRDPALAARSFDAVPDRLMFVGHYHRWFAVGASAGSADWGGTAPIELSPEDRWLVGIAGVREGHGAILDLESHRLAPVSVG